MENMEKMEAMVEQKELEISIEEFSIVELEDRLELIGRCNGSCANN